MKKIILILSIIALTTFTSYSAAILPDADSLIKNASDIGNARGADAAISLLNKIAEQYPRYPKVYNVLMIWQEIKALSLVKNEDIWREIMPDTPRPTLPTIEQKREYLQNHIQDETFQPTISALFETAGNAIAVADGDVDLSIVNSLTKQDFPIILGAAGVMALPGKPKPISYKLTDPVLPLSAQGEKQGLICSEALLVRSSFERDPKYGIPSVDDTELKPVVWGFSRMMYAYEYDSALSRWTLKFRIMWQDSPGKTDNRYQLASNTATLLLRISALARNYGNFNPRFSNDNIINVWLAEGGEAGGESYNNNIYLHKVNVQRSSAEWMREIAHEYGHQVIPVIGGFEEPEWGANGKLGEKIFMRWLYINVGKSLDSHPWISDTIPDDFIKYKINPLIASYTAIGPKGIIGKRDENGMDAFIGFAVFIDITQGGRELSYILNKVTSPSYDGNNGFLKFIEQQAAYYYEISSKPVISLRMSELPINTPVWVFLSEGIWQGKALPEKNSMLHFKGELDDLPMVVDGSGNFMLNIKGAGWHNIKLVSDNGDKLNLLKLVPIKND
jgi:hypothetical protein